MKVTEREDFKKMTNKLKSLDILTIYVNAVQEAKYEMINDKEEFIYCKLWERMTEHLSEDLDEVSDSEIEECLLQLFSGLKARLGVLIMAYTNSVN